MSSKNRRNPVLIDVKRLASYAIAGTTAACGAELAEAEIFHFDVNRALNSTVIDRVDGVNLIFTPTGGGANWNFSLGHVLIDNAPNGYAFAGNVGLPGLSGPFAQFAGRPVTVANLTINYVAKFSQLATGPVNLAGRTFIGGGTGSGVMASRFGFPNDEFKTAGVGFLGVKFNVDQFGWIRVNMNGPDNNNFTVVDYAYADKGQPINFGQIAVPEPSSLSLLALGSVGILAWRRRRAAALTSAA